MSNPDGAITPIAVTVVAGYLGAGKTTLLNHLLKNAEGRRLAVVVNDFGALNIDAELIESHDGVTYALTNGCVCCSIADSFEETLQELARGERDFDEIVIEASGVAEPGKIVASIMNWARLILTGVVVVVDSVTIVEKQQDKYVGKLVQRQLEGADLLVLNKTDLLEPGRKEQLHAWLDSLGGTSARILVEQGAVPPSVFFGRSPSAHRDLMQRDLMQDPNAGDLALFYSTAIRVPETLDKAKFQGLLATGSGFLIRAKGFLRFESGSELLQLVGHRVVYEPCASVTESRCVFIGLMSDKTEIDQIVNRLSEALKALKGVRSN